MNLPTTKDYLRRCRAAAAGAALLLPGLPATAQTINNPSFETDTFLTSPGYASDNGGAITGWTSSKPASIGLNPAGGSPFADNGTIPHGANVAFLQSTAGGTDLSTTVSGLTAGTAYRISFRANARGGQTPNLKVSIDSVPVNTSVDFGPPAPGGALTSVNSANPHHYVSFEFTPAGTTSALTLLNDAAGDNTVCVDDFSIALASNPLPAGIVATRWTGDEDSGIDPQYRYTHARTFGNASVPATVNGVYFTVSRTANPESQGHGVWTGFASLFGEFAARNFAAGTASRALATSFMYGGPNTGVTIGGLKPNTTYVATIYSAGWEDGTRSADFSGSAGGGPSNVNLDSYGVNNGITVRYRYTTDAAATPVVLSYPQAAGAGSFHTAAFSNREAVPGTQPANSGVTTIAPWNDNATSGVNEGGVYLYTHAYNLGSGNNAVINGVTFKGKPGGNPSDTNFSIGGFRAGFGNDANNVVDNGGSRTMANDFIYDGFPGVLNLTGLTPGTEYQLTLFTVGFDATLGRSGMLSDNGYAPLATTTPYDQAVYGNNNGLRINHVYTAPPSGSITITTNPTGFGSLHLYGFANRKTAPETNLAFLSLPETVYATPNATVTFTATASGFVPLTYEWRKNGVAIPGQSGTTNLSTTLTLTGVTAADEGDYTVAITGSGGQGTIVSSPAAHLYYPNVPGLFDTGFGHNCAALPEGREDPHYTLITNPDGDSFIPAVVHDSSGFPLSWAPPAAGPWLQNNTLSKWIGPKFNTVASAGEAVDAGEGPGVYVYETTFDLTGFDLSTVWITGGWATDNLGVKIKVNGLETGLTNTAQFPVLTNFSINTPALFVSGVNTLQFYVQNQTVTPGYTGLRVEGLRGYGTITPGTAPRIVVNPVDTVLIRNVPNCIAVQAGGSGPLSYQWYKILVPGGPFPIPGATNPTLTGGFTTPAQAAEIAGDYYCVVTNGFGTPAVSATAAISIANNAPVAVDDGLAASLNTAASVSAATLTTNDTDGDSDPLTVTAVGTASAQGGTVTLSAGTINYTPPAGYTGADSFTYTVSDGWGGLDTGSVNVTVYPGPLPPLHDFIYSSTPTTQNFTFRGIPGATYILQRSPDLFTWTNVSTQVAPPDGIIPFQDLSPLPGRAQYRISWTP